MTHEVRLPLIVVQQHSVLREALSLRLEAESDFDVVASVATVTDAATALAAHPSAVVVLDEPSSPEMCRSVVDELRSMSSTARLVMLVNTRQLALVSVAVNAGVAGVLCSDTPTASLAHSLRTVSSGASVLDGQTLSMLAASWRDLDDPALSMRELEVLSLLACGSSNAEIASQLYVSTETIKTHVAHLLRKLQVPNRAQAVKKAERMGLIPA
jgi:DNA-binding NarL/FixJ family response regulator